MGLQLLFIASSFCLSFILGLSIGLIRYMIKMMIKLRTDRCIINRKLYRKLRPIYIRIYTIIIVSDIFAIVLAAISYIYNWGGL